MNEGIVEKAYCSITALSNLFSNQFIHPILGLVVVTTGVDSWNDERHGEIILMCENAFELIKTCRDLSIDDGLLMILLEMGFINDYESFCSCSNLSNHRVVHACNDVCRPGGSQGQAARDTDEAFSPLPHPQPRFLLNFRSTAAHLLG